jgi:hypothetical protein
MGSAMRPGPSVSGAGRAAETEPSERLGEAFLWDAGYVALAAQALPSGRQIG